MRENMTCFALEKIIMTEVSEHVNVTNCFHDVNTILCAVNNIHPKAGIFRSENLVLSTVTSIQHPKKYKVQKLWNKVKGRCETLCKAQMSNRSEKREIELINKEVWWERKQKVPNRINWFTYNVQVI